MSGLLDKQVNAQKQKIVWGLRKLPQAHEKCAMKIKVELEKNDTHVKVLFMEGSPL